MKKYTFGIVGTGLISDCHARAIADIPQGTLAGFCGRSPQKAQFLADRYNCRAYNNFDELLSDDRIDIVTICTPSGAHMEPAVAAALHGKHVLCEKPLEITPERIDTMIGAHEQAGTQLGCIFQNRFTEAMAPLRQAVNDGRFGTITYAGAYVPWWRAESYYNDSWHGTWALDGGGALMNQSIHMIDMLCDLMGPVASVKAFTANIGHPQIEAEDTSVAALKFVNGALGVIYGTTASWPGAFKRFEITGTTGTVVYLEDHLSTWQFAEELPQDAEIRTQYGPKPARSG
ncbi:MAG: Gfo/Idh/MocA family oxidoreductase, partial [Phycisphaerae bacterium]|nr:Gfo/Idh/MocA family oxidoreductase [Phycisphaerae bacterium]